MNDPPAPEDRGPTGEKKFFGASGRPSLFNAFQRISQGHTNPAFKKDDDDDDDDDDEKSDNDRLSDPKCNSSDESDTTEVGESISNRNSLELNAPLGPVSNGRVPNRKDFSVVFDDITEQGKPPPSPATNRKSKTKKVPKQWDRFTQSSSDNISSSDLRFWDNVFIVTKIIVAVLLFIFTFATAVVAKICFIIITANIFPSTASNDTDMSNTLKTLNGTLTYAHDVTNVQWIWALILMAGAPYFFSSVKSLWRLLFQMTGRHSPDCITILVVLAIESIHSVGLNVMMFVVMPNLDPISGLMISLCIGVIPGVLKVIYPRAKESKERSTCGKIIVTTISIIGAIGQLAAIGLWFYHVYNTFKDRWVFNVCLVVAPIFTSIHWWENYVHEGSTKSTGVARLARNMRKFRTKLMLYSNIWKSILTILIPTALYGVSCKSGASCIGTLYYQDSSATLHSAIGHVELISANDFGYCYHHLPMIIAIIGVLSSGLCFKVGKVACKIMTQIIDYSLPLVLSTPAAVGLVLGMYGGFITIASDDVACDIPFPHWSGNNEAKHFFESFMDKSENWYMIGAGLCGFLSLLLVTNHVWMPGKERLQTTDKLFVQPLYCGIFLDQSLLLNRRRIERIKRMEHTKSKLANMNLDDLEVEDINDKKAYRRADTPMIYMCATMWHETENEMLQLLKSIFRMDEDQCTRRHAQYLINRRDPDYYEFEAHIFFDDAFEGHEHDEYEFTVNDYVRMLMTSVKTSASSIHGAQYKIQPPVKIAAPYGGRLVWNLPGQNKLIAHLKDKTFIRHRKRWSQVMYMYYFLGYEMFKKNDNTEKLNKKKLHKRAENTFLLALDGDVDFHPRAVQLLIDRMRKNEDVGAACGRIHPIGNGAMVWYQKFEYAVSHWLQKAAEDKFGCVLCSPGCFSLFRGLSLMDDNVMNRYTTPPSEPRHYVQYDQGEDRWLCTLLLQQGHRVEYCAASDALTYAPEGFNEFFNQRRRWTPSTMANIMDLLTDWKNVTKKNPEITLAYILYQALLMVSSILTPGTIFLMILGAINLAYPAVDLWVALIVNTIPVAIMILLCFKAKGDTQLAYAAILSTLYSLVMMIVIVGLLRQAAESGICSVTTAFLCFVAGVFILAAFIHPQEFWCIIHGFLYFLAIPSMSMILMLYALGNLNNVSWGTRESKSPVAAQEEKEKSRFSGVFAFFNQCCPTLPTLSKDDANMKIILDRLDYIEQNVREMSHVGSSRTSMIASASVTGRSPTPVTMGELKDPLQFMDIANMEMGTGQKYNPGYVEEKQKVRDRMSNPYWMTEDKKIKLFNDGEPISRDETQFWWELIEEYLKPLEEDKAKKEEISAELTELRNKVCLIFILINSLFIIIVFSLQQVVASGGSLSFPLPCAKADDEGKYKAGQSVEPISVAFTLVFGVLLFVQFCCMLLHRIATLLHICAATEIFKKKRKVNLPGIDNQDAEGGAVKTENAMSFDQKSPRMATMNEVYEMVRDMQKDQDADSVSMSSESSYAPSEVDDDEDTAARKADARARWKDIAKRRKKVKGNTLGANFRKNFQRYQSVLRDSTFTENDQADDKGDIEILRKKTQFNRMGMKSMKLLNDMAKNPETKEKLARKKIVKLKFKELAKKATMGQRLAEMRDNPDGPTRNTPSGNNLFTRVVEAAKAKKRTDSDLEQMARENSAEMQEFQAEVHNGDHPMYESLGEEREKETTFSAGSAGGEGGSGSESSSLRRRGARTVQNDTDSDTDYDDVANKLSVPKVENDEWPEEEHYAQAADTADVLF